MDSSDKIHLTTSNVIIKYDLDVQSGIKALELYTEIITPNTNSNNLRICDFGYNNYAVFDYTN